MNNFYAQKVLIIVGNLDEYMLFEEKFGEIGIDKSQLSWVKSIEQITSKNFDLVIFDLNSPVTNRTETLAKIKLKLGQITILVLTTNSESDFAIELLKEGIQDVLVKGKFDKIQLYKSLSVAKEKQEFKQRLLKAEKQIDQILPNTNENWYDLLFSQHPTPKFLCREDDLLILKANLEAEKLLTLSGKTIEYIDELFEETKKKFLT